MTVEQDRTVKCPIKGKQDFAKLSRFHFWIWLSLCVYIFRYLLLLRCFSRLPLSMQNISVQMGWVGTTRRTGISVQMEWVGIICLEPLMDCRSCPDIPIVQWSIVYSPFRFTNQDIAEPCLKIAILRLRRQIGWKVNMNYQANQTDTGLCDMTDMSCHKTVWFLSFSILISDRITPCVVFIWFVTISLLRKDYARYIGVSNPMR